MNVKGVIMNVGWVLLDSGVGGIWLFLGPIQFKQWAILVLKQCAMQFEYSKI